MARPATGDGIDATGRRIAPVLARWRHAMGWTQDELASRAGISRGYLSRLERGLPGRPGLDVLTRVCGAMGHTWVDLFSEAGLSLPGDLTLDDMRDGLHDPELILYLRRLPELDERDRAVLRALLRAFFERTSLEQAVERASTLQLMLPGSIR